MNPVWGNVVGVITVILMLSFLGTWIWVWNKRHKKKYYALSRIPMQDGEDEP